MGFLNFILLFLKQEVHTLSSGEAKLRLWYRQLNLQFTLQTRLRQLYARFGS